MMRFVKWKSFVFTALVCILPIIFGIALWDLLPEDIAIHFDFNNRPDNYASKGFAVFGLPLLMVVFQLICCVSVDMNSAKYGENKRIESVAKWIIPCVTVVLHLATLGYAINASVDIRRITAVLAGLIFIVTGICVSKLDYIKHFDIDTKKAKKINRFVGYESLLIGLAFIGSIILPSAATSACVILIIPCLIIGTIYGIKIARK